MCIPPNLPSTNQPAKVGKCILFVPWIRHQYPSCVGSLTKSKQQSFRLYTISDKKHQDHKQLCITNCTTDSSNNSCTWHQGQDVGAARGPAFVRWVSGQTRLQCFAILLISACCYVFCWGLCPSSSKSGDSILKRNNALLQANSENHFKMTIQLFTIII